MMGGVDNSNTTTVEIGGVALDLISMGAGSPLLFLHGGAGPDVPSDEYLRELARDHRVIAPWHPGFGRHARPNGFREIGDLAYLYLDLADQLDLQDAVLVGSSFGGWIAAEMMVRNNARFSHLVLSAPLGIKVRGREERDIEDFFAMTDEEFRDLAYADPKVGVRDLTALNDEQLATHFRSLESLAFYGWKPYMHNPQLKLWLHRIAKPTLLVTGKQDRFVFDGYFDAYNEFLSAASHQKLDGAGHFPHVEKPKEFAKLVHDHRRQVN